MISVVIFREEKFAVNNVASSGLKFSFRAMRSWVPSLCTGAIHFSVLASHFPPLVFLKHCRLLEGIFRGKGYQITRIYNSFPLNTGESFLSLSYLHTLLWLLQNICRVPCLVMLAVGSKKGVMFVWLKAYI